MQDATLYEQLIEKLRVKSDVTQVIVCLEEFNESFFSSKNVEDKKQIFNNLPKEIASILIESFTKETITPEKHFIIKRKVEDLSKKLRSSQSIQLTLAFKPDEQAINLFSDWIKKNINKNILLDLQFDKSIVGGALIIAGGVFKDYSVRKTLANRFQIQRDDIIDLLK